MQNVRYGAARPDAMPFFSFLCVCQYIFLVPCLCFRHSSRLQSPRRNFPSPNLSRNSLVLGIKHMRWIVTGWWTWGSTILFYIWGGWRLRIVEGWKLCYNREGHSKSGLVIYFLFPRETYVQRFLPRVGAGFFMAFLPSFFTPSVALWYTDEVELFDFLLTATSNSSLGE